MKKWYTYAALACLAAVLVAAAVYRQSAGAAQTEFVLDTIANIRASGRNSQSAVEAAFARVREIDRTMSAYRADSDLNTRALHADTEFVLQKGLAYGALSDGLFDISILPLVQLWNVTGTAPRVPAEEELAEALKLVDYTKVRIENHTLLLEEGMAVDLGGIAKGYAADEAAAVLRSSGITDGVVDLGGNIVALGEKRIGLRDPFSANDGDYMCVLEVADCAVVTSGSYERYFEQDGVRYHHILDPRTGKPAGSGLVSVTVVADNAIDGDALSTAFFIAGREQAEKWAEQLGVSAVFVDENRQVHVCGPVELRDLDGRYVLQTGDPS